MDITRDKNKASLLTAVKAINAKRHFELLKPDFSNLDEVYTNYFNLWLWNMSDNKQGHATITNEWIGDISKLQFCKTKDGFKLTESDFIKVELNRLEILDPDKLSLIESKQFERYVSFLKSKFVNSELPDNTNTDDWFVVGLLFATGKMDELVREHNGNATRIARQLDRENLRPCISDSLGSNKEAKKNLFNSRSKMMRIIEHCENNNIEIKTSFLDRLPPE
jgi:hypothetical protein